MSPRLRFIEHNAREMSTSKYTYEYRFHFYEFPAIHSIETSRFKPLLNV